MTTDPVHDAAVHNDAIDAYEERREASRKHLQGAFLSAVARDLDAEADFAPEIADYSNPIFIGKRPTRKQLVWEVMADSIGGADRSKLLDHMMRDAMKTIVHAGRAGNFSTQNLLIRMAQSWALENCEGFGDD